MGAGLDRLERRQHHREAALHVGDAGAAEHAVLAPGDRLERVVDGEHRVHVAGEQDADRRVGADREMEVAAMRDRADRTVRIDAVDGVRLDQHELARKGGESIGERGRDISEAGEVARAAVDGGPGHRAIEQRGGVDPGEQGLIGLGEHGAC